MGFGGAQLYMAEPESEYVDLTAKRDRGVLKRVIEVRIVLHVYAYIYKSREGVCAC